MKLENNELNLNNRMDATVGILKNIASRNIISNNHALLELIKNGFDEDSSEVLVNFIYNSDKLFEIRVIDDGYGFTEDGFDSFRLIGKSGKILNGKTPLGRVMTGMYGSGAYSSIKLGNYLKIISANYEKNFFFSKEIDWSVIYKYSNKSIRELSFTDSNYNFSLLERSGTELIIKNIKSNFDLNKVMRDLLYITIRKDFTVRFIFNGKSEKTINFIERLNYIKQFDFVQHSVLFSYLKGKVKIELSFDHEKYFFEFDSKVDDFQGMISGEYLSIDKELFNKIKTVFSEKPLFKKRQTLNLFYNNEMLVLTDELLGLNLELMTVKEGFTLGFRNSLGYTAIQETQIIFNESRTNITDDSNGQYQRYKIIIEEIFNNITKKIRNIKQKEKNNQNNLLKNKKVVNSQDISILSEKNEDKFSHKTTISSRSTLTPQITPISIKNELLSELEKVESKLIETNPYYNELSFCIHELNRIISQKNYMINFNIAFFAVIRVYCEILFIYKVYDFFKYNKIELDKTINICKKKNYDTFKSIGGLINVLLYNNNFFIKKLSEDFREKTNQNKLENVSDLIKEINSHIHKPSSEIREFVAYDLIRIFTKWL